MVPFSVAIEDASRGNPKLPQSSFKDVGRFPVVDQGQRTVAGYTDDETLLCRVPAPVIVFGDHTRAFKYVDHPFVIGADGVKVLRVRDGWDPKYVYHYFATQKIPSAGYSRHFKFLKELGVPRPEQEEQRRIAAILDHADAIRVRRRQALKQLDDLIPAIFLDMFGDPAINPNGFAQRSLGSLAMVFRDGPFGSNLKSSHYVDSGVRVIRLQNIGVGRFVDKDRAYVTPEHFASLKKHQCGPGDVLIATLGDPNLRACIQPEALELALNKADCVQMRVDSTQAGAEWVCALVNMPGTLRLATALVLGQTRSRISMGRLRELKVPVPPLEMQREFSAQMGAINAQRVAMNAALDAEEQLFQSLQARAFRGEL